MITNRISVRLLAIAPFLAVVAVALVARLAWIAHVHPLVGLIDDAGYYDFFAASISDGNGYVRPEGTPTAFWPVGYPGALAGVYAVFGHSLLAAKLSNVVLGALTAGLVFLLARRWFSVPQATLAGLIFACFPGAIGFVSLTMSETLFTFLFMAVLYLTALASRDSHQLRWALALGVVAVAAAYVRGQALALPLFAFVWLLLAGWRWRQAAHYSAVSLVVVIALSTPWLVRNTLAFDQLTFLSTNTGLNFWHGHNSNANGGPDYHLQLGFTRQFEYLPLIDREPAWNREGFKEGLKFMLTHPLDEARLSLQKVIKLYEDDSDAVLWNEQNGSTPIFTQAEGSQLEKLFDSYFFVAGALGLAGLAIGALRRERWFGPLASVVLLWTLVHVVFYGEPRLHVPILPIIAIIATVPVIEVLGFLRGALGPVAGPAEVEPETSVP